MLQATAVVRSHDIHMMTAVLRWNFRTCPGSVFDVQAMGAETTPAFAKRRPMQRWTMQTGQASAG